MKKVRFNCAPSLDRQVDIPSRKDIHEICSSVKSKIVDQVFDIDSIVNAFGYFISRRFRVDVLHAIAREVEQNEVSINAYYDSEKDEEGKISIELVLVTNPSDTYIIIDKEAFYHLTNQLADSLAHELIHMRQARARDFLDVSPDTRYTEELEECIQYLGDPDEIEAYAYNIAAELSDRPDPMSALSNPSTVRSKESINLWAYVNTFSRDISNPVIRRLLKKVYKNLSNSQING